MAHIRSPWLLWLLAAMFFLRPLYAGDAATPDEDADTPLKPAERLEDPEKAAQASARMAADFLKKMVDEKQRIWIPVLIRQIQKVVGLGEPIKRKEAILKVVGYRDEYRFVPDPNDPYGKIYKKVKVPIYEKVGEKEVERREKIYGPGGPEYRHYPRWVEGHNALAAYALLRVGEPADGPALAGAMEWFVAMMNQGLPDTTYELSTALMFYVNSRQSQFDTAAHEALEKLLFGQIEAGDGKGQWGHYCINNKVMTQLREEETRVEALLKEFERKYPPKPPEEQKLAKDKSKKEKEIDQERFAIQGAVQFMREKIIRMSREFRIGRLWFEIRHDDDTTQEPPIHHWWPVTMYDAREERLGNLIDTQFALMALAEASRAGLLQDYLDAAEKEKKEKRKADVRIKLPVPPGAETIAKNAAAMRVATQKENGRWGFLRTRTECKDHPFPEMADLPKAPKKEPKEAKQITAHEIPAFDDTILCTASAMHAFSSLCTILGKEAVLKEYGATIDKGLAAFIDILKTYLQDRKAIGLNKHVFLPFSFWLLTPDILRTFDPQAYASPAVRQLLIRHIIETQNEDGSFGTELTRDEARAYKPPYVFPLDIQKRWEEVKVCDRHNTAPRPHQQLTSTAFALIAYSHLLKLEVAGFWPTDMRPTGFDLIEVQSAIMGRLQRLTNMPMAFRTVSEETLKDMVGGPKALIVSGGTRQLEALKRNAEALVAYVQQGGTLISLSREGGFHAEFLEILSQGLPKLAGKTIPEEHPALFLAQGVERKGETRALWLGDRLAVYFTGWDPKTKTTQSAFTKTDPAVMANIVAHANALGTTPSTVVCQGPQDWPDALEVFTRIRCALLGIKPRVIEAEALPEEKKDEEGGKDAKPEPAEDGAKEKE